MFKSSDFSITVIFVIIMQESAQNSSVDKMNLIERLIASNRFTPFPLSEFEVINLCFQVRHIFLQQPMLLELSAPITICGDVHGHFDELLKIFEIGGVPRNEQYLFLGDYVDRGNMQLETICLLFAFKAAHPLTFHLLRGNHECLDVCTQYGFFDVCMKTFNGNKTIFDLFISVFDTMPVAATVNKKMFCVHGGISPELESLDQIRLLPRPTTIPESGLLCDLVWSDPDILTQNWSFNTSRGTSVKFGPQNVLDFLAKFNFDIIVRAHEIMPDGYRFFCGIKLLTIFSCSNYRTNHAVFMKIDQNLNCNFHQIV